MHKNVYCHSRDPLSPARLHYLILVYLRSIHPMPLTSAGMPALLDILARSTGLAPLTYAVLGKDYTVLARLKDVVHACSNLSCVAPLKSEWQSNNLGLCSGSTSSRRAEQNKLDWTGSVITILHGLSLSRTRTGPSVDQNIAKAYIVLSGGRLIEGALPSLQGWRCIRWFWFYPILRQRYTGMV